MQKIFVSFFFLFVLCLTVSSQMAEPAGIEQYLNIRSAGSPTFSPDGRKIAFLTNITGTNQIWMVDSAGGYPEQITAFEDNVSFVRWSPVPGGGLVFGVASGGNENTQLFRMNDDGSGAQALTHDPKVRHNFGGFSRDGKRIYYSSNKRNPNYFDVYAMKMADGSESLIYKQDGSNWFAAASFDDSKIIVSRSSVRFSNDNDLYLVETSNGKTTHLTPHAEATQYTDVEFLADGRIIFGTDQGSEFNTLSIMDVKTGGIVPQDGDAFGDLDGIALAPDGQTLASANNSEGFSSLYLRALMIESKGEAVFRKIARRTLTEVVPVELPAKGVVGNLEFSPDGRKLAFTFNSPVHPTDIWVYDLRSEKLTQITRSSTLGIPRSSFVEPVLIKYKSFDGREIPAWYYKPADYPLPKGTTFGSNVSAKAGTSELKIPRTIVSVHGGPASQARRDFSALNQYYLSRGYAILETNVRGSTGYGKTYAHLDDIEKREDSVKDLASAVEWLKTEGGADPKRVAIMGGSYGGYMTMAAITLYPELFAAAVNTVGIVNWETFLKNTSGYRRTQREVEYGFLDKDLEFLRSVSPIYRVDKIRTPLFVIHGKNDPRVPYTEAEQLVEALRKRGAPVEYKLFDDEGHGISKLKNRLELYPLVADFLDKHLK
ncbi:MAG: S9 family peptidase [Pyrinomonadaceae bacterium]